MKKGMCLVLCFLIMMPLMCIAHAEHNVMPCYDYVSSISATLSITSGIAKATGMVNVAQNQKTSIIVRLQRETRNGSWITIASWSASNNSGASEAGGTKSLNSGYNYRVYVTGKVYNDAGSVIETINKYSVTKSY